MTAIGYLSGGGGGGGAVDSVNGETGAVILDATNTPPVSIGAAPTVHTHDDRYFTEAEVTTSLTGKSDTIHDHDTRYFTEAEVMALLATKANKLIVRTLRIEEATNLTYPNTAGAWQNLTGFAVSVPVVVGDYCELTWANMYAVTTGNNFLDWHIFENAAIVRAMSSDTATPKTEGSPWMYPGVAAFDKQPGPWGIVVTAPMIVGGLLTCRLAAKSVGTGTIYRDTTYPYTARLKNFGPADVA
jgi:hypothetical protein